MIGLQIYTVRQLIADPQGCESTLRRVKEMGYECVQLAGDIDTIERAAAACAALQLPVVGILGSMRLCRESKARWLAAARLCGAADIGISSAADSAEKAAALIPEANAFAAEVIAKGFSFSYHNHSNEFIRTENGKTVMELLLEGFDPRIRLMPDTYWLQHGGMDVRDFIERHAERIRILHLKDMKRTAEGPTFAELGVGNLNLPGILHIASELGITELIVEQDKCDGNPLTSAEISCKYLKNLLK
ncbi:MAG: sugar phosphate isomerase/epimerase [Ruminococcaceae bacterium]|nr:sugar phosphate isomerase/epimerase [Oscillospiraceae bacterium]